METPLGHVGTIISSGKPNATFTLIISSHGFKSANTIMTPFGTAIAFCTPSSTALVAGLGSAIQGLVQPAENPDPGPTIHDYDLSYFEGDPRKHAIAGLLNGTKFNVLVIRRHRSTTLGQVLTLLDRQNLRYPRIWCLFCRVAADQYVGSKYVGPTYHGTTHPVYATTAQQAGQPFLTAQEIRQKIALWAR